MCWTGYFGDKKIATADKKVFKVVKAYIDVEGNVANLSSYYKKCFKWELGERTTTTVRPHAHFAWDRTKLNWSRDTPIEIEYGIHSYDSQMTYIHRTPDNCIVVKTKNIFAENSEDVDYYPIVPSSLGYRVAKMECIIPKGTTYYENSNGEIVSEVLIPKRYEIYIKRMI